MKRMNVMAITATAALMVGCVNAPPAQPQIGAVDFLQSRIQQLIGTDSRQIVDRIGYATTVRQAMGDAVFTWSYSRQTVVPIPEMHTTVAMVGNTPVYGTESSTSYQPVTLDCTIEIGVDESWIVKNARAWGNNAGCAQWANAFR